MRIRRRKWAKQELEETDFYIDDPTICKNKWKEYFKNKDKPIFIELGCGKGKFIAQLAVNNPDKNYIAADMIEAMLGLSKRNIESKYLEEKRDIDNLYLIRMNAERILDTFGKEDKIERIYINFCNPWPRGKHKKRRLTHSRQLENYKTFLAQNGEIYFKTDNDELFEESIEYFENTGFEIVSKTYDLQKDLIFEDIITEHEIMYTEQNIKIKALIAKLK